jgi:hypothetical protein
VLSVVLAAAWLVAAGLAAFGTSWAFDQPDPLEPDGDPCCPNPDTWGDVVEAGAGALLGGIVLGGFAGLIVAAAARGLARRPGPWRLGTGGAAAGLVLVAVLVGLAQWPHHDEGWERADCDGFAFRPADWRSPSSGTRQRTADALGRCGTLDGLTEAQVRERLGTGRRAGRARTTLEYRDFPRGRVFRVELVDGRVRNAVLQ